MTALAIEDDVVAAISGTYAGGVTLEGVQIRGEEAAPRVAVRAVAADPGEDGGG
jgi:hypothetical protein